jgi:hypothetical protein
MYQNGGKYTKGPENMPKGPENWPNNIYQHLQLKDPPKFTQNGVFVLKINHLATLEMRQTRKNIKSSILFCGRDQEQGIAGSNPARV